MPLQTLHLPEGLRTRMEQEARAAFPAECCGLVAGVRKGDLVVAMAIHPARNLALDPDRFEIDPAEQFRLLHELRNTEREIVGCYHSHPNGKALPSAQDRHCAVEEGFVWLICGWRDSAVQFGAFVFENGAFRALNLAETACA